MGDVIPFKKNPKNARCAQCEHVWDAEFPVGAAAFECPACSMLAGFFVIDEGMTSAHVLICACGSASWNVTMEGVRCEDCDDLVPFRRLCGVYL